MLHKKKIKEIQEFATILMNLDGTLLSWNQGVEKIKGYKEHEILGKNFRIFYLPSDREAELPEKLLELAKVEAPQRRQRVLGAHTDYRSARR